MLIEGSLMPSLACTAADVVNLNSSSLLALGLAGMTSLQFSLDWTIGRVMEEKRILPHAATLTTKVVTLYV